jgi:PAS domain S-box-containing protein
MSDTNNELQIKALADEKLKRNALINNIPDLMWSIDKDYRLIDANQSFYSALLYLSGKPIVPGQSVFYENLDEPGMRQWVDLYNRAFLGETFVEHIKIVTGDSGWAEVTLSPIYDGDLIVGVACHSKDINQRVTAEELIRQSEINMAHAQRLARIGSWDIEFTQADILTQTAIWSDETFRILGYDKNKTRPTLQAFIDRLHPNDKDFVMGAISGGINNNDNSPIEYRIILPDGNIRWLKTEGEILHNANGSPVRIVGTHQDITEAKQLQTQSEKITRDLIQRNKELEQFAYIVSHNLRGPVSNIIGLTNELLITPPTDEIYTDFLAGLKNSTDKLDEVIKDLGYILQRKQEVTEQREIVNLSSLVEDIKGSIKNMITESGTTINYNFDEPEMLSLKTYLYSIFYNLVSNSIKYRKADVAPIITITGTNQNGFTELIFADNGMGIDLEIYGDKVFGLYKRFHNHTEGKGMGLYMVKSQVESLGGTINISSQLNRGTIFTLRFKN